MKKFLSAFALIMVLAISLSCFAACFSETPEEPTDKPTDEATDKPTDKVEEDNKVHSGSRIGSPANTKPTALSARIGRSG